MMVRFRGEYVEICQRKYKDTMCAFLLQSFQIVQDDSLNILESAKSTFFNN